MELKDESKTTEIPIVSEKELLAKLSFSFYSGPLSFVIPLLSHFYFTLNMKNYMKTIWRIIWKHEEKYEEQRDWMSSLQCIRPEMPKGHLRRLHVKWQWGSLTLKNNATPLPRDFWACLQKGPLPTHAISFREGSDIFLKLLCSDANLKNSSTWMHSITQHQMRHLRILPLTISVMFSQPFEDSIVVQSHYNPITCWHMIKW